MGEESGNLLGKVLKVATVENLPLSGTMEAGNKISGIGMAFQILEMVEEALNFTHVVVATPDALDSVEHGEVDFVAALLPIPNQAEDGVVFSTPIASEKWVLLMRRPEESLIGSGLLAPFTVQVWLMSISTLILMGPIIYLIIKLRFNLLRRVGVKCRMLQLKDCVWFSYGAIMKQGSTKEPSDDTTRILFASWWIFITILTSYYTANLTAFLTLSRFSLPLEKPEDLVENNLRWFGKSGGSLEQAINGDESELSFLRDSLASGQGQLVEFSDDEILEWVMRGHVYLGDLRTVQRLVYKSYQQNFDKFADHARSCTLVYTTEEFMTRPTALAFPKNSSLPHLFNPKLSSLVEGGVIRHILASDIPESEICPLHLGNAEKHLKLADFTSIYLAVVCGFAAALAAFWTERFRKKLATKKREMRILHANVLPAYPKDFVHLIKRKPQHVAFMDPKIFITDKSKLAAKFRLKQQINQQLTYLE